MASAFSGNPNDLLTYTSPSTKWILNASGVYVSGTTLRTSYNASGVALGLLVEEARTNLLLRSQEIDHASWGKTQSSVTANATISPDGTANAEKLIEDTTAAATHNVNQGATLSDNSVYAFTFYAKAAERSWVYCQVTDKTGAARYAYWNLSDGSIGTLTAGLTATEVVTLPNGWYRVGVTFNSSSGGGSPFFVIGPSTGDTGRTYDGDGTSGIYVWQAQLELGSIASSPIVTTSSSVTRAADNVTLLNSLFPWSFTVGTAVAKFIVSATTGTSRVAVGQDTNGRLVYVTTSSTVAAYDGTSIVSNGVTVSANTLIKAASSWGGSTLISALNGASASGSFDGVMGAGTTLTFGGVSGTGFPLNGYLQSVMILPQALNASQLQALTA